MGKDIVNWVDQPVWLMGIRKSGTSLLMSLCDGHRDLLVYPEEPSFSRLFNRSYQSSGHLVSDWIYGMPTLLHLNRLIRDTKHYPAGFYHKGQKPIPPDFSLDPEIKAELITSMRFDDLDKKSGGAIADVFDIGFYHKELDRRLTDGNVTSIRSLIVETIMALSKAFQGRDDYARWVFKYPTDFSLKGISWFFQEFTHGTAIVIVRDPRGQLNSAKLERNQRPDPVKMQMHKRYLDNLVYESHALSQNYTDIDHAIELFGSSRIQKIYYEDLVQDPENVMKHVADIIGVAYDPVMSTPTRFGVPVKVGTGRSHFKEKVSADVMLAWQKELSGLEISVLESCMADFFNRSDNRYQTHSSYIYIKIASLIDTLVSLKLQIKHCIRSIINGQFPLK